MHVLHKHSLHHIDDDEMVKDGRKQNQILSLLPWEFHKDIQSKKHKEKEKNRKKHRSLNVYNLFTPGFF